LKIPVCTTRPFHCTDLPEDKFTLMIRIIFQEKRRHAFFRSAAGVIIFQF
jgi:hypothetical protein